MKKLCFFFLFLMPFAFGFTGGEGNTVSCSAPTKVSKTSQTSTSLTFAWNGQTEAVQYKLKYVLHSDGGEGYTSPEYFTTNTSYTFSNLASGSYSFYFATVCDGGVSEFIIIDDVSGN